MFKSSISPMEVVSLIGICYILFPNEEVRRQNSVMGFLSLTKQTYFTVKIKEKAA